MTSRRYLTFLLACLGTVFIWSAIAPYDRFTWFLEVLPVMIALPLLAAVWGRFPFSRLACFLMLVHAIILLVGGHYT